MSNTWPDNLEGIPTDLAEAIRDVWHQADTVIVSKTTGQAFSTLTSKQDEHIKCWTDWKEYVKRYHRLHMKLKLIPSAIETIRSIDPQAQPRLLEFMVTLYLDVLKYDIDDAQNKCGLRRLIERSWKRLTGAYKPYRRKE
jgi:hypothetical protein